MYAIIKDGGRQYKVEKGVAVAIDKRTFNPNDKIEFGEVLLLGDGDDVKIGTPMVPGVKVFGEVVKDGKGKKVRVFKYKKGEYHKAIGFRRKYTLVKITDIKVD